MSVAAEKVDGRLADNIIYFCHTLRRAGVPVATSQVTETIRAVEAVGFTQRQDFHATLKTCLVSRREHLVIFDQVFGLFWRDPEFLKSMMQMMLPSISQGPNTNKPKAAEHRAAEAMMGEGADNSNVPETEELVLDAQLSVSDNERLGSMDFEQMSQAELSDAKDAIADLEFNVPLAFSRRKIQSKTGRGVDAISTLRAARRHGGEIFTIGRKKPKPKPRNLVVLCDISGSMSTYSRMMLYFIHHLLQANKRAFKQHWVGAGAFTFGTRLSNVTRLVDKKDPDEALAVVGNQVVDWDGGTQIGNSLKDFNQDWSRRVLGSGAIVLLITDGLERDGLDELEKEMIRLKRSCDHLIWLNPLLRFDGFQPEASGIKIMLRHADQFVSCHNIESLKNLARLLSDVR